jgi:hypothetical protein
MHQDVCRGPVSWIHAGAKIATEQEMLLLVQVTIMVVPVHEGTGQLLKTGVF